ncbi:zonular occludens toxin domain-containing protein [Vallitalea guaymasensis]|uniref:zonular occludens toxin domain-containing protein n=1 Tax=Vallitalea guaymasensis TaxID=1185412 RepID=UPI00187D5F8A|nr:zonular occludens toxin domain-containing protein [Vallitalea guaymasensis]
MIEAITGLPGAGKTLMMMRKMMKEQKGSLMDRVFKLREDEPIITNFKVNEKMFPNAIYISNDEISTLYDWILQKKHFGANIFLDEASILFPSLSWKSIPNDVIIALRQHRHAGYNMYYTAQDLDDVASGLRRVTQFATEVNGWSLLRFSTYGCYSVRRGKINRKDRYDRGILFHTNKLYNSYDTHFNIDTPDYVQMKGTSQAK